MCHSRRSTVVPGCQALPLLLVIISGCLSCSASVHNTSRDFSAYHSPEAQPKACVAGAGTQYGHLQHNHSRTAASWSERTHALILNTSMAKAQAAVWRVQQAASTTLAGGWWWHGHGGHAAGLGTLESSSSSRGASSSCDSSSRGASSSQWVLDPSGFDLSAAVWYFAGLYAAGVVVPAGTALFFDYVYSPLLVRHKLAVRTTDSYITRPWQEVLWIITVAIMAAALPASLLGSLLCAGAFWPVRIDTSLRPIPTLWSVCITLLLHDAYYYWLHRAMHISGWLYRQVHATHHDPTVMMEARTGMVITAAEGLLSGGLFYAVSIVFNCLFFTQMVDGTHVFNLWVLAAPILSSGMLGNIGHSGLKYHTPLPLLVLNPLLLALLFPGTAHSARDHQLHHERCGCNFALYFRHMDEWFGTAAEAGRHKRAPSSLLLMAYNLTYYATISWALANLRWLAAVVFSKAGLVLLCCSALMPLPRAGWQWLRRLSVWDRVRQAYACTVSCKQELDPSQSYIFAYHPHGLLSRGWWLLFGLQGKQSPLASLRMSLALHRAVVRIPLVGHVLALIGVCDADKATLVNKLNKAQGPQSVALVPGGWAEARLIRTNKLLLSKRLGFIKLVIETGAQLVPVLGIGEERIGGAGATMLAAAVLLPAKAVPLHVVVGAPMAAAPGEDAASLHARYVAALLQLGKQHGVELAVV